MDKRLAKRHKRQVARAKEAVKTSEPDVRTQEEIEAARSASRSENTRGGNVLSNSRNSGRSLRSNSVTATGSSAKTGA